MNFQFQPSVTGEILPVDEQILDFLLDVHVSVGAAIDSRNGIGRQGSSRVRCFRVGELKRAHRWQHWNSVDGRPIAEGRGVAESALARRSRSRSTAGSRYGEIWCLDPLEEGCCLTAVGETGATHSAATQDHFHSSFISFLDSR